MPIFIRSAQVITMDGVTGSMHVLETKTQLVTGSELYGGSLVEYLSGIGALSPNTTFPHGIWLTRDDMDLVAAAGTSVAHNPISNLKLGSGIAAWRELHDAGVNLGSERTDARAAIHRGCPKSAKAPPCCTR